MGASITMAKGAADAVSFHLWLVIGDSTFSHSGLTGLLDAVYDKSNVVIVILDNSTTGMTGGQDFTAFGKLEEICIGLGVPREHIRVVKPLKQHHDEMVQVFKEEMLMMAFLLLFPVGNACKSHAENSRYRRETMKKDIILAGVGGQGILTIATVIGSAAVDAGLFIKQARSAWNESTWGDVQSHLRISDKVIYSDCDSVRWSRYHFIGGTDGITSLLRISGRRRPLLLQIHTFQKYC